MQYILVALLLFIGVIESIRHHKLTVPGAIAGGVIGLFLFIGAGWTGISFLVLFFLLGIGATSWKQEQKMRSGMQQEGGGQRKLGQVIANGGVGGTIGFLSLFLPLQGAEIAMLMAGAFSAALADTLSSELGTVYGKKFYNIISFKKDEKGLDGVISIEGTLIGATGSALIAMIYCLGYGWDERFFWIVLAGTIGNIADSILGATLERKKTISNDVVNFLNTLIGALVTLLYFLK